MVYENNGVLVRPIFKYRKYYIFDLNFHESFKSMGPPRTIPGLHHPATANDICSCRSD